MYPTGCTSIVGCNTSPKNLVSKGADVLSVELHPKVEAMEPKTDEQRLLSIESTLKKKWQNGCLDRSQNSTKRDVVGVMSSVKWSDAHALCVPVRVFVPKLQRAPNPQESPHGSSHGSHRQNRTQLGLDRVGLSPQPQIWRVLLPTLDRDLQSLLGWRPLLLSNKM